MATKLYGKDLKSYEDLDVDALLAKLTPEELEELNNDVDPDNSMLPPHARCRDQTSKEPTGPLQREKLLRFLEEKAKQDPDWEEKVPYKAGMKRGKAYKAKEAPVQPGADEDDMPIELDVDDDFDVALGQAGEQDLVDLAGILGMHSMLSQTQYYRALKGVPQEQEEATFAGIVKSTAHKLIPDEPPNDTDIEDCTKRLKSNDPSLVEVNINNMKHLSKERIGEMLEACKNNSHLERLNMANTAIKDADVKPLVDVLEQNKSLTDVNIESNFISGEMLAELVRATLANQTLVEFHAENQRQTVFGNQVEMDIMRSIEENDTLLRVGITFDSMEARHRVSEALERNYEQLRLKRVDKAA